MTDYQKFEQNMVALSRILYSTRTISSHSSLLESRVITAIFDIFDLMRYGDWVEANEISINRTCAGVQIIRHSLKTSWSVRFSRCE